MQLYRYNLYIYVTYLLTIFTYINIISGLFWWIYLLLALLLPIRLNKKDYKIIKYYFYVNIAVLIYDAYYRFFINVKDIPGIGRYAYKYGLIGIDSEFRWCLLFIMFLFFFVSFKKVKYL